MPRTLRWTPGVAVPPMIAILACVNVIDVKVPRADWAANAFGVLASSAVWAWGTRQ